MSRDACFCHSVVRFENKSELDGTLQHRAHLRHQVSVLKRRNIHMVHRQQRTMATTKQVSEASYFLCCTLNHNRAASVPKAKVPKTNVVTTSRHPIGSRVDI